MTSKKQLTLLGSHREPWEKCMILFIRTEESLTTVIGRPNLGVSVYPQSFSKGSYL